MRKIAAKSTAVLTEEQTAFLKKNALGMLSDARRTVLNRFPFYGTVGMSLDLVPVRDTEVTTMATDGQAIYCDIDFLSKLSNDDKVFIVCHEILHNVMLHPIRRGSRDHELFNLATDMEVNDILKADGLSVPKDAVMPEKYCFPSGKSAEEYYELLLQKQSKPQYQSGGKGGDSTSGAGSDSDGDDTPSKQHNPSGELKGQFDQHIYKDDPAQNKDDNSNCNQADSYGKLSHDSDYRPTVTESAVERIRESAVTAAQVITRQGGTLPGHLQRIVNELLEPKLDWREVLAKFLTKGAGDMKRTWNTCNRRFISAGTYLPSSYSDAVKVGVVLDTSGSVVDVAGKFLSEVNGIVQQFTGYSIDLIQCDTRVTKADHYDEFEPLDLENIDYKIEGGGGTILRPGLNWFEENAPEVNCIVVFTDGYCDELTPENTPNIPILWVVTNKNEHENLKVGEVVNFDKD